MSKWRGRKYSPEWLRAHGYDGLYYADDGDSCGCTVDDLYPACEDCPGPWCKPGHKQYNHLGDWKIGPYGFKPWKQESVE
jgi:hypothetical protein